MRTVFYKRMAAPALLLAIYIVFSSHEFWLSPNRFIYRSGDLVTVSFLVGEGFEGDNWSGNRERVSSLKLHQPSGIIDLTSQLGTAKGDSLRFMVKEEGTGIITFNSTNSFITLGGAEFNAYLEEDGLVGARRIRDSLGLNDSAGREFYQRSVKSMIQVGKKRTNVSALTGLPLELVPQTNPYSLGENDSLTVKLYYNKTPLANHKVRIWHRNNNILLQVDRQTDANGNIHVPIILKKKWMVSAVHMVPLRNNPKADWQSYWTSLTWGYE